AGPGAPLAAAVDPGDQVVEGRAERGIGGVGEGRGGQLGNLAQRAAAEREVDARRAAIDVVDVGLDDGGEAERPGRPPQDVRQCLADLPRNGADAVDQGGAVGGVGHPVVVVVGVDAVGQPVAVGVGEAVVDQTVAVVVEAVADLGRWSAGGAGLWDAGDAVVDGALADANPTCR